MTAPELPPSRSRRRRLSIRARLTLAATAVTAIVLGLSAFAIIVVQGRVLTAGIDEGLRQRADNMASLDGTETSLPNDGDRQDTFLQLLRPDGSVQAASSNVMDEPSAVVAAGNTPGERFATTELTSPAHDRFRVFVRLVDTPAGPRTMVIGKNLDDVSESVHTLAISLGVAAPAVVALLALLAWWLTGHVLGSVDAIRREVSSIGGDQLHRRVPVPATNDEITDLARTMNDMLGRVEDASRRQQRFVDDASHELRTPLTRMIAELEIASAADPDGDDTSETYQRLLDDATDLRRLTDDLLWLARSSGAPPLRTTGVDLDDLALAEAKRIREQSSIAVDSSGIEAAQVTGSPSDLARAVRNLVDNAIRFASSSIALTTITIGDRCELIVGDDGPGVPMADRLRIFERFARLDDARSRDGGDGGAGLGLAIVRDITAAHGGSARVEASPTGGARFVLSFPSADRASEAV